MSDRMSVFTLQTNDNAELIQARKERLNKQLEHLNNEEKKTIEEICEDFYDIFHLEDDTLTFTTTVASTCTKSTKIDSAPVNIRPYRLPEKHKEEVNRQITKMLDDDIIRLSTSQWNPPLLVVPKKIDASGKQKLRIVIDFRKLNDLT